MSNLTELTEFSNLQNGVVTRSQLLENGFSKKKIEFFIKKGYLNQFTRGVYEIFGSQNTWEHRANLAIFSCGKKALLSHESVLLLYGLIDLRNDQRYRKRRPEDTRHLVHVLNPRKDYRDDEFFFHRTSKLLKIDENNVYKGIAHVSIVRALIDCNQQLSNHELSYCIDRAYTLGLINQKDIWDALLNLHTGPGREKKRIKEYFQNALNETEDKNVESYFEKRVENIIGKNTKHKIVRQYEIIVEHKKYRLDFAIPELKIAIEADGFQYHKDRDKFDGDKLRDNLLSINGWKVLHITAKQTDTEIMDLFLKITSC